MGFLAPLGALAGTAAQGVAGGIGAGQQEGAAREALARKEELGKEAQRASEFLRKEQQGVYEDYGQRALDKIGEGFGYADRAAGQQIGSLASGLESASGTYGQIGQIGLQQLPGATQAIGAYDVTGARSRLGEIYDKGFDFEASPAYQHRLAESEKAIGRAASAGGGRLSGATLKALQENAQGLASQEYDRAYQRQIGLAGAADQSQQALLMNQAARADRARLAAQQNQYGLAQTGLGAMSRLGQLQYGAGQDMANVYGGLGAQQLGLLGQQAGVYGNMGRQIGSAIGAQADRRQQTSMGLMGAQDAPTQYAGGGWAAAANTAGQLADYGAEATRAQAETAASTFSG